MSTVPRNPTEASTAEHRLPVVPAARHDRELDRAVREFDSTAEEFGIERPTEAELRDLCQRVADICGQFFPGELRIEVRRDHEIPDDLYFVFNVGATGSADEIVARSNEWHRALCREAGSRGELFCLSFDVH